MQKSSNRQMDFERVVEQRLGDISRISFTFESKLEEMNKISLSASVVDELLSKIQKMENLTFSMEDMLKESYSLKQHIVEEHNAYVDHVQNMNKKIENFLNNVDKIDERSEKVEELFYMRNEFGNFVLKEEFSLLQTIIDDMRVSLNELSSSNNSRHNKSNKTIRE